MDLVKKVSPETEEDINPASHGATMGRTTTARVTVTLPHWVVEKLEAEVKAGRYASLEEAVLTGAKLLAGLGPRARELLAEGAEADQFIRADDDRDRAGWL